MSEEQKIADRKLYLYTVPNKRLWRRQLKQKIDFLTADLIKRKNHINKMVEESVKQGEHLKGEVFIPEYLGFTESQVAGDDDTMIRIYTKEGYNMSRVSSLEESMGQNAWLLLTPDSKRIKFVAENLYEAIVVLKALGAPVSIDAVLNDDSHGRIFDQTVYGPE